MTLSNLIIHYQQRIEQQLDMLLASHASPAGKLQEAMRYAVLGGGKRIRPVLVYASTEACGGDITFADPAACAVELIHAYSLVHDDLPAMDDDDLRRGQPTCHKAFDEATAILAGDALQSLAFETITGMYNNSANLSPTQQLNQVKTLAVAAGANGMVTGQALDLAAVGDQQMTLAELEQMHRHKTGALIRASVQLGAIAANATTEQHQALTHFADNIGLAFQVKDDILDVEMDTSVLGKRQGADAARNKPTYPALLGLEIARQKAHHLYHEAIKALSMFDEHAKPLRDLASFIVERHH
ncbi:polyprenyl synthetase family protein [Zooshikella harenae]|uniref:Polyprenyl synthetase family protein n=1 Tax=Zooshikella harenae TaxID=2827238 RepID=A0ABS5ZFP4_9GAMM|nr:farnesyl diphosphate synthase [Zooshikella harenae]MBU2712678.1 polyprenyl synthetase family protein [Zooshikella harenae]